MRRKFVLHNRRRGATAEALLEEENNSVTSVTVSYSTDYDIVSLDVIVRQLIVNHCQKLISELEQQLVIIDQQIDDCCIVMEMRELDVARAVLASRLLTLKNDEMLHKYSLATASLLAAYRDTPTSDRVIDAMNRSQQLQNQEEAVRERTVDAYMALALELALPTISITKEKIEVKSKTGVCQGCNSPLVGCDVLLSGLLICATCGSSNKRKTASSSLKDYDSLSNLLKAHRRYTGTMIPKCNIALVKENLDKHFLAEGDYDGEHYRQEPLDERGRKEGTSIDGLCYALKMLGYDDLYKHYMYVGHHYYGWRLPDLKHIEDAMISNFRIKQDVWDNNMSDSEKGCQSNLCVEYRLCREHQHAGYDSELEDYKISRKRKTLERYDSGYAIMCKRSGFEDIFSIG